MSVYRSRALSWLQVIKTLGAPKGFGNMNTLIKMDDV